MSGGIRLRDCKITYIPLYEKHRSIQNQYPIAIVLDNPNEGRIVMVHGGDKSRRSIRRITDGAAWKLMSEFPGLLMITGVCAVRSLRLTSIQGNDSPVRNDKTLVNLKAVY